MVIAASIGSVFVIERLKKLRLDMSSSFLLFLSIFMFKFAEFIRNSSEYRYIVYGYEG